MTLLRRLAGVALALGLVTDVLGGPWDLGSALHAQERGQPLYFSVVDTTGSPITDMTADEFEVRLGGTRVEILSATLANEPMQVTVLVDNSGTTRAAIARIRDGLRVFLDAMPQGHEVALVTLSPQARWIARHTTDREELKKTVDYIVPDRGGAAFVDALVEAGGRFEGAEGKRPVIVAITSNAGQMVFNETRYNRFVQRVIAHGATVHSLLLRTTDPTIIGSGGQSEISIQLTQITGGRYESVGASVISETLESLAEEISRHQAELANQYRVIYARPEWVAPDSNIGAGVQRADWGLGNVYISLDGRLP